METTDPVVRLSHTHISIVYKQYYWLCLYFLALIDILLKLHKLSNLLHIPTILLDISWHFYWLIFNFNILLNIHVICWRNYGNTRLYETKETGRHDFSLTAKKVKSCWFVYFLSSEKLAKLASVNDPGSTLKWFS